MRGPFPDQVTIKRSNPLARERTERFQRERGALREYSTLETVIVIILGILTLGFAVFILRNYL
ncbi:hypothetical protein APY94_00885 [Thermococcus celericrescens]|uniref:Uncharacterized protein n=1 Tax=Thermococcus celericrescens TaxID=227598 RepID=A0A117IU73_9EURY|nr:hypothetical protein [Thermococcus celericrescens]KUH34764.1 hypothetical protein APY94_00885 [Thermococcus celericrescens]